MRNHSTGGAGRVLGRGRRRRVLPRLQRALREQVRGGRPGPGPHSDGGERAHGLLPAGRPADPGLVGRHGGAALSARDRRYQRGSGPGRGGRSQARGDEPQGVVLRAADHARRAPGQPLDRGAAAPARLLPGDRRGPGARRHLARARPRPGYGAGRHPGRGAGLGRRPGHDDELLPRRPARAARDGRGGPPAVGELGSRPRRHAGGHPLRPLHPLRPVPTRGARVLRSRARPRTSSGTAASKRAARCRSTPTAASSARPTCTA